MIQYFPVLYAGHVLEGDAIGFDGTPHDDHAYDNKRLALSFDIAKELSISMENLGYDILWMTDQLTCFAEEVMPAFKTAPVSA